jgi:hypothetical protein
VRLHVLVEGSADEAFFRGWLPRFLPGHTATVIPHRGKGRLSGNPGKRPDPRQQGLLDQLPAKLRAYGRTLNPETDRVLVVVDLDEDSCTDLKSRLLALLDFCDPRPVVLFRIAIEETEAFYLGDPQAVRKAFPSAKLAKLTSYAQDSICNTAELFRDVIGDAWENKVEWAERMANYLAASRRDVSRHGSPSFRQLCRGLLTLAGEVPE